MYNSGGVDSRLSLRAEGTANYDSRHFSYALIPVRTEGTLHPLPHLKFLPEKP